MNELQTINDVAITVKEHKGVRIVTFKDIDAVHGRPDGTARKRFNDNREHFIEGEDFFVLNQPSEIRTLGIQRPQGGTPENVTLITESGYLMLVKSFTDDLAWEVQRELVKGYFRVKKSLSGAEQLLAQAQYLVEQERRLAAVENRQDELTLQVQHNSDAMDKVTAAYTAPLASGETWQESANRTVNSLVEQYGLNHQNFRRDIYAELEFTAGVDLQQRVTRLQSRMKANGATVTQCRAASKLTVIAQDKKLRAIFDSILRRRALKLSAEREIV